MHMGFGLRGRAEGGGFGGYVGMASSGRELPGPALASMTAASKASVAASCSSSSTPPMCVSPKKICGTVALSASLSMPCVRVTSATRSPRQQSNRLPPTWPPRLATVRASFCRPTGSIDTYPSVALFKGKGAVASFSRRVFSTCHRAVPDNCSG